MLTNIVHSSGRFDRPVRSLDRAVNFYRSKGSLIFHTEATALNARELVRAFGGKGWTFAHIDTSGADDCAIQWKDRNWELIGDPFARRITNKTWVRAKEYGGAKAPYVRALVVPLVFKQTKTQVLTVDIHMPLDNTRARAAAWVDCCKGLVELKKDMRQFWPRAKFIISADWNKNWRETDERGSMRRHLSDPLNMTYSWSVPKRLPPGGGTHGKQIIDGFYSNLPIKRCYLLKDDASSDHRPMGGSLNMGE